MEDTHMNLNELLEIVKEMADVSNVNAETKLSEVFSSFEFVKFVLLLEDRLDRELDDETLIFDENRTLGKLLSTLN